LALSLWALLVRQRVQVLDTLREMQAGVPQRVQRSVPVQGPQEERLRVRLIAILTVFDMN